MDCDVFKMMILKSWKGYKQKMEFEYSLKTNPVCRNLQLGINLCLILTIYAKKPDNYSIAKWRKGYINSTVVLAQGETTLFCGCDRESCKGTEEQLQHERSQECVLR